MNYFIRAPTKKETDVIREKVTRCFEAAAKATGCTVSCHHAFSLHLVSEQFAKGFTCVPITAVLLLQVDIEWQDHKSYLNVISNEQLGTVFHQNGTALGIEFDPQEAGSALAGGGTDMGNASYEVPSIHPVFNIETSAGLHTREFTADAGKRFTTLLEESLSRKC